MNFDSENFDGNPDGGIGSRPSGKNEAEPRTAVTILPPDPRVTTPSDLVRWGEARTEIGTELLTREQRAIINRERDAVVPLADKVPASAILPLDEAAELGHTLAEAGDALAAIRLFDAGVAFETSDERHAPETEHHFSQHFDHAENYYVDALGRIREVAELGEEMVNDYFGGEDE